MDEIYTLVKARVHKVHELHDLFVKKEKSTDESEQNQISQKFIEDIRKSKEEEKFRTEKENWILNVLKQLKEYTIEQKFILYERSQDIMKLIYPQFQQKNADFNVMKEKFTEEFISIYIVFFSPFEKQYEFRTNLRYVTRLNNPTLVPDMLKYLVEFSRDFFKKFMIFQSQARIKQQTQQTQQSTSNQNNPLQQVDDQQNTQSATNNNLTHSRSKSTLVKTNMSRESQKTTQPAQIQEENEEIKQDIQLSNNKAVKTLQNDIKFDKSLINKKTQSPIHQQSQKRQLQFNKYINYKTQLNRNTQNSLKSQIIKMIPIRNECNPFIQLKWYYRYQQENILQTMKNNMNDVVPDLDSVNIQLTDFKIKRLRNSVDELKNLKQNMFENFKSRNFIVNNTCDYYYDRFVNKFGNNVAKLYQNDKGSIQVLRKEEQRIEQEKQQYQQIIQGIQAKDIKIIEQKNFIIHPPKSSNSQQRREASNPSRPQPKQAVTIFQKEKEIPQALKETQNQQFPTQQMILQPSKLPKKKEIAVTRPIQPKQNKQVNENNLLTKTKIIKLSLSRCNSAFLKPYNESQSDSDSSIHSSKPQSQSLNQPQPKSQSDILTKSRVSQKRLSELDDICISTDMILDSNPQSLLELNDSKSKINENYTILPPINQTYLENSQMTDKFKILLMQRLDSLQGNEDYQRKNEKYIQMRRGAQGPQNMNTSINILRNHSQNSIRQENNQDNRIRCPDIKNKNNYSERTSYNFDKSQNQNDSSRYINGPLQDKNTRV